MLQNKFQSIFIPSSLLFTICHLHFESTSDIPALANIPSELTKPGKVVHVL